MLTAATRKLTGLCGALLLATLAGSTLAQPREMTAGEHYAAIDPPVATATNPDVIEVLDVFWYGCPVCMEFEPMMSYYGSQVRGDVAMNRMPAIWNPAMRNHAQVYFTAVELRIADRAHPAAFRHVQEEGKALNTPEQARDFFALLGVPEADFATAWNSEAVATALARAEQKTGAAGIDRLPALLVNGRYRVVRNKAVQELPELVVITNQLIRNVRTERRIDID